MADRPGIVIVGAGQAGGNAAIALRHAGYHGRIVLIGEESHIPYERPPLSKELLAGNSEPPDAYLTAAETYVGQDIELRLETRVESVDCAGGAVIFADGSAQPYDKLMLATGARVRRLGLPGEHLPGVHYLRDITDSLAIRSELGTGRNVVVIGGGYIGLEVAASARKYDANVTVLEMMSRPMNRVVAPEVSQYFLELHRARGVEIRTDIAVAAIEGSERVREVVLGGGERLAADVIVIGVGIVPNGELAAAAGLAVDNGVCVDEFGRTGNPAVFAAGDLTNHFNPLVGRRLRLESWQNAQNQAIAVAGVMAGGEQAYAEIPWFWSDQYDVNLQLVGAPERWDHVIRREGAGEGSFTFLYLAGGRLVAAHAINNGRDIRPARRIIAAAGAVAADELADPGVKLADLVKRAEA